MSYTWGANTTPGQAAPHQVRPPRRTLRDRLADIDLGRPHYYAGRLFWFATTWIAGAFAGLSLLATNPFGALQWGTLCALGLVAQTVLQLEHQLDQITNPRRIGTPVATQTLNRLGSTQPHDTRDSPPAAPTETL